MSFPPVSYYPRLGRKIAVCGMSLTCFCQVFLTARGLAKSEGGIRISRRWTLTHQVLVWGLNMDACKSESSKLSRATVGHLYEPACSRLSYARCATWPYAVSPLAAVGVGTEQVRADFKLRVAPDTKMSTFNKHQHRTGRSDREQR